MYIMCTHTKISACLPKVIWICALSAICGAFMASTCARNYFTLGKLNYRNYPRDVFWAKVEGMGWCLGNLVREQSLVLVHVLAVHARAHVCSLLQYSSNDGICLFLRGRHFGAWFGCCMHFFLNSVRKTTRR